MISTIGSNYLCFWKKKRQLRHRYAIQVDLSNQIILGEWHYGQKFFLKLGLIPLTSDGQSVYPAYKFEDKHMPYIDALRVGAHPMAVARRYLEDQGEKKKL